MTDAEAKPSRSPPRRLRLLKGVGGDMCWPPSMRQSCAWFVYFGEHYFREKLAGLSAEGGAQINVVFEDEDCFVAGHQTEFEDAAMGLEAAPGA